jgi:hypothetical protein
MQVENPLEGRFGFVFGNVKSEAVGVVVPIQITLQLRIRVAIDAIDGRKYAPSIVMRSQIAPTTNPALCEAQDGA